MADKKISQLTDGTSLQSGDAVVIARSGDNYKVDPTQFGSSIDVTGTVTADGADLNGAVVINESGANVDFRVEGDTDPYALFINGDSNNVALGTALHDNEVVSAKLELRDEAPEIKLRNKVDPTSVGQVLGRIRLVSVDGDSGTFDNRNGAIINFEAASLSNQFHQPTRIVFYNNMDGDSSLAYNRFQIDSNVVVNEDSNDVDFRVESDGSAHMLFVDAGNNRVGINNSSPAATLDVNGTVTADGLGVTFAAGYGSALFYGSNNTRGDLIAGVDVKANGFRKAGFRILDQNDNEDFFIGRPYGGTNEFAITNDNITRLYINSAGAVAIPGTFVANAAAVINEDGGDNDFRVESDSDTNMLFVDAGNNRVGIGTSSPSAKLDINGGNIVAGQKAVEISGFTSYIADGSYGTSLDISHTYNSNDGSFRAINIDLTDAGTGNETLYGLYVNAEYNYFSGGARIGTGLTVNGPAVINESSGDADFRVESNTDTHAFFVDGGTSRVGVGTSSPSSPLHLQFTDASTTVGNSYSFLIDNLSGTTGSYAELELRARNGNGGTPTVRGIISMQSTGTNFLGNMIFSSKDITNTLVERMRIDSSGNLLIGKTNSLLAGAGAVLGSTGFNNFTRDGASPVNINRLTSDGDLVTFYKDGTEVGSIGTASSGNLYIEGSGNHSGFEFGTNTVAPLKNGAGTDAVCDIGGSSNRFKDLYLSGGVYLGGTGAANLLDDYEEGTWTPTVDGDATGAFTNAEGFYRKVGNVVHLFGQLLVSTGFTSNSIGGVPFSVADAFSISVYGSTGAALSSTGNVGIAIREDTNAVSFFSNMDTDTVHNLAVETYRFQITYMTS